MSFYDLLERLRGESESRRKVTAVVIAFSLTGIVFIGWLMAASVSSSVFYGREEATSTSSPFAAVGEAFKAGTSLLSTFLLTLQESKKIIFEVASSTQATGMEGGQ